MEKGEMDVGGHLDEVVKAVIEVRGGKGDLQNMTVTAFKLRQENEKLRNKSLSCLVMSMNPASNDYHDLK